MSIRNEILTVELYVAVGFAQRVLGHTAICPEIIGPDRPDFQFHVFRVATDGGCGLVLVPGT